MVIRREGQSTAHWMKPHPPGVAVKSAAVKGHSVEMRIHHRASHQCRRQHSGPAWQGEAPSRQVWWAGGGHRDDLLQLVHLAGSGSCVQDSGTQVQTSSSAPSFKFTSQRGKQRGNKYLNTVRFSFNSILTCEASNAALGRDSKVQPAGAKAGRGGQHGELQGEGLPSTAAGGRRALVGSAEWRRDAWRGGKGWRVWTRPSGRCHTSEASGQERSPIWFVLLETPHWGVPVPKRTGGKQTGGDQDGPGWGWGA